jgi:serine/threonine protein kinase/tetratricopeptide (TPR) repeat protein
VVEHLGTGGFGTVYKAIQENIGREVALKFLTPGVAEDPINVERFRREAYHVSQLRHPNTITLYDYGQTEDGLFYMVMELLEGISLADTVEREGALSLSRAAHIFIKVLKSLSEAHQNGLVHRDLKPENIYLCEMFGEKDYVKVLDFGVAKMTRMGSEEDEESDLTKQGHIFGTPMYMAPEQACDEAITPATDVYALGLLIFEMMTGLPPVQGTSRMEVIHKQIRDPVPELPTALEGTPLGEVIRRACRKDEEERYEHAGAFLEAFVGAIQTMEIVPRPEGGVSPEMSFALDVSDSRDDGGVRSDETTGGPAVTASSGAEAKHTEADETADAPLQPEASSGAEGVDGVGAEASDRELQQTEIIDTGRGPAAERTDEPLVPEAQYDAPFVNRDEELGQLRRFVEGALDRSEGGMALLEGENGVGKTRVVREFRDRLANRELTVLTGHFRQHSLPMEGIREALADYWDVSHRERSEVADAVRDDLEASPDFRDDEIDFLVDFLRPRAVSDTPVPESPEEARALYAKLEQTYLKLSERSPLVLVFEDLHQADSATLGFLEYLAVTFRTQAVDMVAVVTLRPEDRAANPDLEPSLRDINANLDDQFQRIPVPRLQGRDLESLLDAILPLESALKERIAWLSQGIPLHAIQIVRYLESEERLVERDGEMALAEGSPREIELPPDLMDLMDLRVEQAVQNHPEGDQLQAVVEWLAILGMRTPVELLDAAVANSETIDNDHLEATLETLADEGLIRKTIHRNLVCVEFENNLLRETLTNELAEQWTSQRYNREAAVQKIEFYSDRDMEVPLVEVADHWRRAGELEQYRDALHAAARRSMERFDPRGARERFRELLELLDELGERGEMWIETRLALGELSRRFGEFGVAEEHYRTILESQRASPGERAEARLGLGELFVVQAHYDEARTHYREALDIYREPDRPDLAGIAKSLTGLSRVSLLRGEAEAGLRVRQQLEEILPRLPEGEISGKVLVHLAEVARRLGRLSERYEYLVRARAQLEKSDNHQALADALIALGSAMMSPAMNAQDRFERAGRVLREALDLMRSIGDRHGVAESFRNLSRLEIERGDYESAEEWARKALETHEALGAPFNIGMTLRRLGVAELLGGKTEAAERTFDRSIEYLEQVGDKMAVADVLFAKGVAAMHELDFGRARQELGEARRIKESFGSSWDLFDVRNHLAIVAMWFGNFEEAEQMLEQTLEHVDEHGTAEDRAVARSLMGLLRCFQSRLHLAALEMGRARADASELGTPRVTDFCEANAAFYAKLTGNDTTYESLIGEVTRASVLNDIQPTVWLELLDCMARHAAEREPNRQSARLMRASALFWEAFGHPERREQMMRRLGEFGDDWDFDDL